MLTRNGVVAVEFSPALGQEHYAELSELLEKLGPAKIMLKSLTAAALRWRRELTF